MTAPVRPTLTVANLADQVGAWRYLNGWGDPTDLHRLLSVGKVVEEAGELMRATTRFLEHRGDFDAVVDELGDVIVAGFSAAEALGERGDLVVMRRWETIRDRRYPTTPLRPLRRPLF